MSAMVAEIDLDPVVLRQRAARLAELAVTVAPLLPVLAETVAGDELERQLYRVTLQLTDLAERLSRMATNLAAAEAEAVAGFSELHRRWSP